MAPSHSHRYLPWLLGVTQALGATHRGGPVIYSYKALIPPGTALWRSLPAVDQSPWPPLKYQFT